MSVCEVKDFWEKNVPWSFRDKSFSYVKKRFLRYTLQDYMFEAFEFKNFFGKTVLEVGCGSGIDSAEFLQCGAKVVSVDLTRNACMQTLSLLKEAKLESNVVQCSVTKLPFKPNVFECVYSYGVLHHILEVGRALKEISSVLKEKGKFMGMLYNRNSLLYALLLLRFGDKASVMTERFPNCPYAKVYSEQEAKELLTQYFNKVTVQTCYNVVDTEAQRKVRFQLENLDGKFGWHLIVKGVKR